MISVIASCTHTAQRFGRPSAMTPQQIGATIQRFVTTAARAEEAGFDGVEVHAAHGYLLSQFLSPLVNTRTDEWGGSLENRARLLLEIVRQIRLAVSPEFAVAVKLNSADFQRGGFDADDALRVIEMLAPLGVDADVRVIQYKTEIRIANLVSTWLPVAYPATRVSGLSGDWGALPGNRTVVGTNTNTSGQVYTVISRVPRRFSR